MKTDWYYVRILVKETSHHVYINDEVCIYHVRLILKWYDVTISDINGVIISVFQHFC